jgi:hypothetical protein
MDQVSFWIGRVSRGDTTMEAQLHAAYEQLAGPSEGLGWAAVPRMMAGKLQGIRSMLKEAQQPAEEIAGCLRALKRIEKIHESRNALLHGHWSVDAVNPVLFARSKAGNHGGPPTVTWEIEEFENLWVQTAEGTQMASGLFKTFLRWSGETLGEAWDLQAREEVAGRFTLSEINDSGGGFGSFIHFAPEVELEMRRITIEEDRERFPEMVIRYPWDDLPAADSE